MFLHQGDCLLFGLFSTASISSHDRARQRSRMPSLLGPPSMLPSGENTLNTKRGQPGPVPLPKGGDLALC